MLCNFTISDYIRCRRLALSGSELAATDTPEGFVTKLVPKFTWAVFAYRSAMPQTMQDVNRKIYSEWLPNSKNYEINAGYCVEMCGDADQCPKGTLDENYYSEIWIPVNKKQLYAPRRNGGSYAVQAR